MRARRVRCCEAGPGLEAEAGDFDSRSDTSQRSGARREGEQWRGRQSQEGRQRKSEDAAPTTARARGEELDGPFMEPIPLVARNVWFLSYARGIPRSPKSLLEEAGRLPDEANPNGLNRDEQ